MFGSAGVIGNPMGFARNVAVGIKDFLSAPSRSVSKVIILFMLLKRFSFNVSCFVTSGVYSKLVLLEQSPAGIIQGMAHGTTSGE